MPVEGAGTGPGRVARRPSHQHVCFPNRLIQRLGVPTARADAFMIPLLFGPSTNRVRNAVVLTASIMLASMYFRRRS